MTQTFSLDLVPTSVRVYVESFQKILIEYNNIQDFMNECLSPDFKTKGIYLEAFCVGAQTVLQSVSETINKIREYMTQASEGISWLHIFNECDYLPSVLASFSASIQMIKSGKFNGCKILDICDRFIFSGLPVIKNVFSTIQLFCLKKFYLQTKLWIMEAKLHDPYGEFFITTSSHLSLSQEKNTTSFPDTLNTATSSMSCTLISKTMHSVSSNNRRDSIKYEINADNLPSLIPFSVAVKMLFIGEALIMCQTNRAHSSQFNFLDGCGITEESVISLLNEIENCEQFVLRDFSNLINGLWIKINRRIREISEEIGSLSSELVLMADVYLLGRGDLFQEFILKANNLLTADVTSVSSRNLNTALRDAFCCVYLTDVSDLVDNFSFVLPNRKSLRPGLKTMTMLTLEYNVKWPLHYLFTRDVMKNYNKIFRFLLALKKAEIVLTSVYKRITTINVYSLRSEFIEVKMHLLSIVVNLQNYCLTNVITYEMNALLCAIKTTDMFTDLQKNFSSFLCNILNRLFISNSFQNNVKSMDSRTTVTTIALEEINKKVHGYILKIFALCDAFSGLLDDEIGDNVIIKLSELKTDLYKVLKNLFSLLKKIDQNYWYDDDGSAGHLYNLIMCLDYNRFYQKMFQLQFDE